MDTPKKYGEHIWGVPLGGINFLYASKIRCSNCGNNVYPFLRKKGGEKIRLGVFMEVDIAEQILF